MCVRIQKQTESVVWNSTGDNVRIILAHFGEDAALIRREYRRLHPNSDGGAAISYVHGVLPRPEFCSRASVAAALKGVRSEIDAAPEGEAETIRAFWVGLCERFSVACKTELGR
jgi:hypothetical protein